MMAHWDPMQGRTRLGDLRKYDDCETARSLWPGEERMAAGPVLKLVGEPDGLEIDLLPLQGLWTEEQYLRLTE